MPKAIITYRWKIPTSKKYENVDYVMVVCDKVIGYIKGSLGNYVVFTEKENRTDFGKRISFPGKTFSTLKEAKKYCEEWHGFYKLPMPDINSQPLGEYC